MLVPALSHQVCEQLCSMIPACVSWQPAHSQASVVALPRAQKHVTFPGYFSANLQECGCRAHLSSLQTSCRQLQTVTLSTVMPTISRVSETTFTISSFDSWVRYLHKSNHCAIKVSEETHVKDSSWQLYFQVRIRTMKYITWTVKVCSPTVFSGPGACRACLDLTGVLVLPICCNHMLTH